MSDPTFNSVTIRQDTAGMVGDLLTLDSVDGSPGNGAALSFLNHSADDPLHFVLGRLSARRVDADSVQLDLAIASDPTARSSDDTSPLLSLRHGAGGLSVATAPRSTLAVGGALSVSGAASLSGTLNVAGAATFNLITVTDKSTLGTLSVTGDMTIAGDLGVGILAPRSLLHVEGRLWISPPAIDNTQNALIFASKFGDQELFLNRYNTGYAYRDLAATYNPFPRTVLGATNEHLFIGTRTAHDLVFSTKDTPGLVLSASGSVGVGTTSPQARLDVAGNFMILSGTNPVLFSAGWTAFPDSAENRAEIANDIWGYKTLIIAGNRSAGMGRRVSIWDRLEVNGTLIATGSLGIGTAAPSAALHVSGKTILAGPIAGPQTNTLKPSAPTLLVDGSVDQSAGVLAVFHAPWEAYFNDRTFVSFTDRLNVERSRIRGDGAYLSSSSRQLKEQVTPIDQALAKIEQLEGVYFTWKAGGQGREIGFIAEDVGAVVPELVDRSQPGFLSYDRISALVVQALKELRQSVSELARRMRELENNQIQGS